MRMKLRLSVLILLIFAFTTAVNAQANRDLYRGDNYFKIKNYEKAAEHYQLAVDAGEADALTYYRLGFSYFQAFELSQKIKSIPYFEKAIKMGENKIPVSVYFDLGRAYHINNDIQLALDLFRKYQKNMLPDDKEEKILDLQMEQCINAIFYTQSEQEFDVKPLSGNFNSEFTEFNPVVSADESMIAFTALREDRRTGQLIEKLMVSYKNGEVFSDPVEIDLKANGSIGTAGLSPDGQQMMVYISGAGGSGNLYTVERSGNNWGTPTDIGASINTRFIESTASITPDGKTMYFASNRPGGYGGFDIYFSIKDSNGNWGKPENMGPRINSQYNEDAPFIHPDQKTLYFTSDGMGSMGGSDIFKTIKINEQWSKPYNMGYPVNTTANDNYFTLTADGRKAYFSSDRLGGMGAQDIYTIDMPEGEANIALTMLKGRILNGETMKAIPTKIFLIDNETNKKLDFVYDPDPKTGDYLIILPPAKNYDMIIESEDFLPYTLNINIPDQTYFYELYQMIYLKTIEHFDVKVGQEVVVKNAFYDTNQDAIADMRKAHEAALLQTDSIDAYELMADLMAAEDEEAINYLVELLTLHNPIDNVNFDELDNENLEAAVRTYYYDESDESKFEMKEIDGNTILSLPTFYVTEEATKQKKQREEIAKIDQNLLKVKANVYFDAGKSDLDSKYFKELDKILDVLNKNDNVSVEISGYASAEGNEDMNRELSNKRAISVLEYLNHRGVVRRRIIARGYGSTRVEQVSKEESRRVELKIVPTK